MSTAAKPPKIKPRESVSRNGVLGKGQLAPFRQQGGGGALQRRRRSLASNGTKRVLGRHIESDTLRKSLTTAAQGEGNFSCGGQARWPPAGAGAL